MTDDNLIKNGVWRAAICYDASICAHNMRLVLNHLNYDFERRRDNKLYENFIGGLVPLPKYAYVYVFGIKKGDWEVWFYDKKPTHSGILHMVEVHKITEDNISIIKDLMRAFADSLPRKPWEFLWTERFRYALFAPEYVTAKKKWRQIGVE